MPGAVDTQPRRLQWAAEREELRMLLVDVIAVAERNLQALQLPTTPE